MIPSDKDAYYGESDHLLATPAEDYDTTEMMRALAEGNRLTVSATVGTLTRSQPVEITAAEGATAAELTLGGGLGYTPLTFHGLVRPDGWRLEQEVEGAWERVDQSVEGNDYWQSYEDASAGTWDLVFNVQNEGERRYRLVR